MKSLANHHCEFRDVLKKHKCACWFEDNVLVDECHYHACMRSGRTANGDPIDWISKGKKSKTK